MPRWVQLAAVGAVLLSSGVAGAQGTVAVIPIGERDAYRSAARLAIALRQQLEQKGYEVRDPARLLAAAEGSTDALLARARAALSAGRVHYDGLEFDKAQRSLKEALAAQRNAIGLGAPVGIYTQILDLLAAAAFYDSDKPAAVRYYKDALARVPHHTPDKRVFSPDVLKVFVEAQVVASRGKGSMRVTSRPAAEVYIGDTVIGVTPLLTRALAPGHHLVKLRRAGYASAARWVAVEDGDKAEASFVLQPTADRAAQRQTEAAAVAELALAAPGPGVAKLQAALGVSSVVIIVQQAGALVAAWSEEGRWTRRHQATVARGGEGAFVEALFTSTTVAPPTAQCRATSDCALGQECVGQRCVRRSTGTPFYKTWWFWTIVGAGVAAGVTTGIVLGTRDRSGDRWTADVVSGGMQ
jgi:hypothetical protein